MNRASRVLQRLPCRGASSPWMGLLVTVLQALGAHMGVNLGSGQAAVAEQLLHAADVGSGVEQMRGEAVPQRVRAGARIKPGECEVLFQQPADTADSQPAAAMIQEQSALT